MMTIADNMWSSIHAALADGSAVSAASGLPVGIEPPAGIGPQLYQMQTADAPTVYGRQLLAGRRTRRADANRVANALGRALSPAELWPLIVVFPVGMAEHR